MNKPILSFVLASLLSMNVIAGVDGKDQLLELIHNGDLSRICESIESKSGLIWPAIKSKGNESDTEKSELVSALAERILNAEFSSSREAISVLIRMSGHLSKAGGYSNHVVADSAKRIAASHLVESVVKDEIGPRDAQLLIESIEPAFPDAQQWNTLFEQESIANATGLDLQSVDRTQLLQVIYQIDGTINIDDLFYKMGRGSITTTSLLSQRNVSALARRMAETETYICAHIPALIFFLRNGGDLEKINLDDVRDVREIFARAPKPYASPVLNLSHINALHLKQMQGDALADQGVKRMLLGYE